MKLIVTLFICCNSIFYGFSSEKFDKGVEAVKNYENDTAVKIFTELSVSEPSAEVFYNLGLAYHQQESLPEALWAFETALKYNVNYNDAQFNASVVFEKLNVDQSWQHPYSWFERLTSLATPNTWTILCIILAVIVGAVIFGLFVSKKKGQRRLFKVIGFFAVGFFLFSLISKYIATEHYAGYTHVVILEDETETFEDPKGLKTETTLQKGNRLNMINTNGVFYQIVTKEGLPVWVNSENCMIY